MDAQYGVSLTVNGRASYTVAIGPNIALDLQISPSRGAVLVNNYLVESQQRTQVSTINAIRNGVNKLTLMNKAAKLAAVAPITSNAINQVNTLNNVFGSLRRKRNVNTGMNIALTYHITDVTFTKHDKPTELDRVKSESFLCTSNFSSFKVTV